MYGMIFTELRKYVQSRLGDGGWGEVCRDAGRPETTCAAVETYSDEELMALVDAIAKRTGRDRIGILEEFGEFITPRLIRIYRSFIQRGWTALDLIENSDQTIHRAIRMRYPAAEPPEMQCVRTSPQIVVLTYTSRRRMCALAKGIVRGVGAHYRERLTISETDCMLRGAPKCTIAVRRCAS